MTSGRPRHIAKEPRAPVRMRGLLERDDGRRWLREVPRLVDECLALWDLTPGRGYRSASASRTLPAVRRDGSLVVLKVSFPDRESQLEGAALRAWDGAAAVRLLDVDEARHALLLERCVPGAPLARQRPGLALQVLANLLPRLWIPASAPFRPLREEAGWWSTRMERRWLEAGRPFERRLLEAARDALRELAGSAGGPDVLLHQDLHAGNVLAAEREPWLVIDPKPLVGERAFSLAPIIRSAELGHTRRAVLHRLHWLTDALGIDRARARGWCIGQTVAWSFGSRELERDAETARWLLDDRVDARRQWRRGTGDDHPGAAGAGPQHAPAHGACRRPSGDATRSAPGGHAVRRGAAGRRDGPRGAPSPALGPLLAPRPGLRLV